MRTIKCFNKGNNFLMNKNIVKLSKLKRSVILMKERKRLVHHSIEENVK